MAAPFKVPPNARCVPSYNFSTQKVNVQRIFTNCCCLWERYDFHLFLHLKKQLAGKSLMTMQEEVMTWFEGLAADFYDSAIHKLVPRLNKYLDNAGDYVEK
jgi:hypothetical protein